MRLRPSEGLKQCEAVIVTPEEHEQLKAAAMEPDGKRFGELLSGHPEILDALRARYVGRTGMMAPFGLPVIVEE